MKSTPHHLAEQITLELAAAMAAGDAAGVRRLAEALAALLGEQAAIDVLRRLIAERSARGDVTLS